MSKIEDLLRQKRAAQIRRMEGEPDHEAEAEVDEALAKVSKRTQRGPDRKPLIHNSVRLRFLPHARHRMAQRGMRAKHVYAIWRAGEQRTQSDGRSVYIVTRNALDNAMLADRELLESWMGCAIVLDLDARHENPLLITVLAAGEDTRTREKRS